MKHMFIKKISISSDSQPKETLIFSSDSQNNSQNEKLKKK